jgi:hypothetical protein
MLHKNFKIHIFLFQKHYQNTYCHLLLNGLWETIMHSGRSVAQLVEAPCYKREARGFDSQWRHWNFSLI